MHELAKGRGIDRQVRGERGICLLQMKTITDTRETEIKASRIQ